MYNLPRASKKGMEKLCRHIETEEKYQPVNLCFDKVTTHQKWNEAPWLNDRLQVMDMILSIVNSDNQFVSLDDARNKEMRFLRNVGTALNC
ncbi:hypothetical protein PMIT1323_00237 [Prochlorococcus marinus str. MIT 1323]|nr:hypothetical protein PMIT1323_00237 [Prochlorococcus marinus str. MIT 1323]